MAAIGNIIGAYNINPKRLSSKLSFEIGQVFAAKIVSSNELSNELVLRLLDGWQFPAKLENSIEFLPEGLIRFQVSGFENGKLQLAIVKDSQKDEEAGKSSIEDLINKNNPDLSEEDFDLLKNMVKHNMPLTKENIAKVKTLLDFKDKIIENTLEEDNFINKYLNSKGIDAGSDNGQKINSILRGFFKELKNISPEDLLSMLENNIDLTEENIKSFTKLSKEDGVIYKDLNTIKNQMLSEKDNPSNVIYKDSSKAAQDKSYETIINTTNNEDFNEVSVEQILKRADSRISENSNINIVKSSNENTDKKAGSSTNTELNTKGELNTNKVINTESNDVSLPKIIERDILNGNLSPEEKEVYKNAKELMENNGVDSSAATVKPSEEKVKKEAVIKENSLNGTSAEESVSKNIDKAFKEAVTLNRKEIEALVKEDMKAKLQEIKELVKSIVKEINADGSEKYSSVLQGAKEYMNDFKVFNSISNQYYIIDVPIKLNRDDYQCKLLIKDDRKSGKKIDTKNVSLVISLKTATMGIVDAYVKVNSINMAVDLKCEEPWVKMLDSGKNKLLLELSNSKYNVSINIKKREKEAILSNCSEFFNDSSLNSINIRV